jgi:hypothetical protein
LPFCRIELSFTAGLMSWFSHVGVDLLITCVVDVFSYRSSMSDLCLACD